MTYHELREIMGREHDDGHIEPDSMWGSWWLWIFGDHAESCVILEDFEVTVKIEGVDADTLRKILEVVR